MASCVIFEPASERIGNAVASAFSSDAKVDNDRRIEPALKSECEVSDYSIAAIGCDG